MPIKISAEAFDDSEGCLLFLGYVGLTAGATDLFSCSAGGFDAFSGSLVEVIHLLLGLFKGYGVNVRLFDENQCDIPFVQFLIQPKTFLCISANTADGVKYNGVSTFQLPIQPFPFRTIHFSAGILLLKYHCTGILGSYISDLPFNILFCCADSSIAVNCLDTVLLYHFNRVVQCIKIRAEIRVIPHFRSIDLIDRFA